jgi:hypothetical protein
VSEISRRASGGAQRRLLSLRSGEPPIAAFASFRPRHGGNGGLTAHNRESPPAVAVRACSARAAVGAGERADSAARAAGPHPGHAAAVATQRGTKRTPMLRGPSGEGSGTAPPERRPPACRRYVAAISRDWRGRMPVSAPRPAARPWRRSGRRWDWRRRGRRRTSRRSATCRLRPSPAENRRPSPC